MALKKKNKAAKRRKIALSWARVLHTKTRENGGTQFSVYQYRDAALSMINQFGIDEIRKRYQDAHPELNFA